MKITLEIVLQAYAQGLFPMAESRDAKELAWFDPERRGVLPFEGFHVPRRLLKTLKREPYRITFDRDFTGVMRGCAAREETWINDEIIELYTALHRAGFAHSVEAWKDGALVGGVYGIAMGAAFFGESMFSRATDASKVALVHLMARLWACGFELFDAQFVNDHLKQFGIIEISRAAYHRRLAAALGKEVYSFGAGAPSSGAAMSLSPSASDSKLGCALRSSGVIFSPADPAGFLPSDPAGLSSAGFSSAGAAGTGAGATDAGGSDAGAFSDEKAPDFAAVAAFLQSITQTS
jgi:leucyl/phenylalanyl-tRNA--protein transferase